MFRLTGWFPFHVFGLLRDYPIDHPNNKSLPALLKVSTTYLYSDGTDSKIPKDTLGLCNRLFNPSNAEATFLQSTRKQRILKTI